MYLPSQSRRSILDWQKWLATVVAAAEAEDTVVVEEAAAVEVSWHKCLSSETSSN
jgi:hypothetical protein